MKKSSIRVNNRDCRSQLLDCVVTGKTDDRTLYDSPVVGYFYVPQLFFSDKQQKLDSRKLITRWRLEPKPEDKEAYLTRRTGRTAKADSLLYRQNDSRTMEKIYKTRSRRLAGSF